MNRRPALALCAVAAALVACAGEGTGDPVRVRVARGAAFATVADSLSAKGIIGNPTFFSLYARATGQAGRIKPGTYAFRPGSGWKTVLEDLVAGRILTTRMVIPEGFDIADIAPRIAEISGDPADSIRALLLDSAFAAAQGVPGPTLEGYLYPATYTLPVDASTATIVDRIVGEYRGVWTETRRALAAERGMSEREIVTLASIVEKEARRREEMATISAVYHNRLRIGMPLQADPTVQYALGVHRERLLYAAIDSVADHPYNTYTQRGLPPGPIGSPSALAIDATLAPADVDFLYFVARPDGSHVFSRTLAEHNRARAAIRREQSTR